MVDHDIYLGVPGDSPNDLLGLDAIVTKRFANDFVPRFGDASEGETNLDTNKIDTVESFSGGMFQRKWKETNKVARAKGVYNAQDDTLYPVMGYGSISQSAYTSTIDGSVNAKVMFNNDLYIAFRFDSTTNENRLIKIQSDGTVTGITLPTALKTCAAPITDMVAFEGYFYIFSRTTAGFAYAHKCDGTTVTSASTTAAPRQAAVLRDQLYTLSSSAKLSIASATGGSAMVHDTLQQIGSTKESMADYAQMIEYNGALYIMKPKEGLWRYDGVEAVFVTRHIRSWMTEYNGKLYFYRKGWLESFDGFSIDRIQWFGDENSEDLISMEVIDDKLAILTETNTATSKYIGSDADGTFDARIYLYDGVGFYLLAEVDTVADWQLLASIDTQLIVASAPNNSYAMSLSKYDFQYLYHNVDTSVSSLWYTQVVTSDHDAGYPNIYKSYEFVDIELDDYDSNDTITVEYSFKLSGIWQSYETLSLGPTYKYEIPYWEYKKVVQAVRVRVTIQHANGSTTSLRNVSIHYTLQPRRRYSWSLTVNNGLDEPGVLTNVSGSEVVQDSNYRAMLIESLLVNKMPLAFLTQDRSTVSGSYSSSDDVFTIHGNLPFALPYSYEPRYIAIKNTLGVWELMKIDLVSYDTDTVEVSVHERGSFRQTARAIDDGAEVRIAFMVVVNGLASEQTDNADYSTNVDTNGTTRNIKQYSFDLLEV